MTIMNHSTFDFKKENAFSIKTRKIWMRPDGNNIEDLLWLVDNEQMDILFAYMRQRGYQGIGCSNYIRKNRKFSK